VSPVYNLQDRLEVPQHRIWGSRERREEKRREEKRREEKRVKKLKTQ